MDNPLTKKDKRNILAGMVLMLVIAFLSLSLLTQRLEKSNDLLVNILPVDGTPVLVLQSKVGDDTTPHIHQTYCQILPYKRRIQDDGVFCYVEVITDWEVE